MVFFGWHWCQSLNVRLIGFVGEIGLLFPLADETAIIDPLQNNLRAMIFRDHEGGVFILLWAGHRYKLPRPVAIHVPPGARRLEANNTRQTNP